ncbi:MAG: hypothetical protein ACFB4J_10975 [Elainellaceae cyanobacterium]
MQVWTSAALPLLTVPEDITAEIARYVELQTNKAEVFGAVGCGLCEVGAIPRGLQCMERSLSIYVMLGDTLGECKTLTRIGQTYQRLDRPVVAICRFMDALTLGRQAGDRVQEVTILQLLAQAYEQAEMPYSAADATAQAELLSHRCQ